MATNKKKKAQTTMYKAGGSLYGTAWQDSLKFHNYTGRPRYAGGFMPVYLDGGYSSYPDQYMNGGYPVYRNGGYNSLAPLLGTYNRNMGAIASYPMSSIFGSGADSPYRGWSKHQEGGAMDSNFGEVNMYDRLVNTQVLNPNEISRDAFGRYTKEQARPYIDQYVQKRGARPPGQYGDTIASVNYEGVLPMENTSGGVSEFDQAFAQARRSGLSNFNYKGQSYNTNVNPNASQRGTAANTTKSYLQAPLTEHFNNVEKMQRFQMGGMMPPQAPQQDPSGQHMQALAAQAGVQGDPNAMMGGAPQQAAAPQQQDPQQMIMAIVEGIMQKDPAALEALKQLPPEIQQQVLAMIQQAESQQGGQGGMAPPGQPEFRYGGFIGYDKGRKKSKKKNTPKGISHKTMGLFMKKGGKIC